MNIWKNNKGYILSIVAVLTLGGCCPFMPPTRCSTESWIELIIRFIQETLRNV